MFGFIDILIDEMFIFLSGELNLSYYQIAKDSGLRQEIIKRIKGGEGSLSSADNFVSRIMVAYQGAAEEILKRAWQRFSFAVNAGKYSND